MPTINSWNSNIPVEIAKGGTNATSMATSTGIVKYDGTSLVTSSTAKIDSSNRQTNTSQPAFLAFLGSSDLNQTGNGGVYTLGTVTALTKVFDQGANFNVNGTFTAPVTGKYFLSCAFLVNGCTVSGGVTATIVTSNRSFIFIQQHAVNPSSWGIYNSLICDMDAADTATFTVSAAGEAGNTDDIYGNATPGTYISGYLVC